MNPSLALVEQLLAAERKQEISSVTPEAEYETLAELSKVLQEQARSAIEQSLGEALRQLNNQAAAIMKNLREDITQQTDDLVRQCVEAALRQWKQPPET